MDAIMQKTELTADELQGLFQLINRCTLQGNEAEGVALIKQKIRKMIMELQASAPKEEE